MVDTVCRNLADKLAPQVCVVCTAVERICHFSDHSERAGTQRAQRTAGMAVLTAKNPAEERHHEGSLRTGDMVSAYRIERLLGTGGMGWVFRARHTLDERVVALKVLREDQLRQERAIDREGLLDVSPIQFVGGEIFGWAM